GEIGSIGRGVGRLGEVRAGDECQQLLNGWRGDRSPLILARDGAIDRQALVLAKSLIGKKEENLVPDHGPAKCGAEIIALKGSLRIRGSFGRQDGIEKVAGIQGVVAEKLKRLPMIYVAAGTRGQIY